MRKHILPGARQETAAAASGQTRLGRMAIVSVAPVVFLVALLQYAVSYRVGDAVGILIRVQKSTGRGTQEAYRHQLPRFGINSEARFDTASLLGPDADAKDAGQQLLRLSFSFDEGYRSVSWFDVHRPGSSGRSLSGVTVRFIYSRNDGAVHSVTRETEYSDGGGGDMPGSFAVRYEWAEEADVDPGAGLATMLIGVVLASLMSMLGGCASGTDDDEKLHLASQRAYDSGTDLAGGYAKSL